MAWVHWLQYVVVIRLVLQKKKKKKFLYYFDTRLIHLSQKNLKFHMFFDLCGQNSIRKKRNGNTGHS